MGARFSMPTQTGPGTHPASCTMVSFLGMKRLGRAVNHPPPLSTKVKERVELYLYSPYLAFMACSKVTLLLSLPLFTTPKDG